MINKRGQVTIFIILAIVIVAGVILLVSVRENVKPVSLNKNLEPVYENFLDCLEQDTRNGVDILGTGAGYIYPPAFESGSSYMPLSSQLDFMGNGVPYWYYVSGNNIVKEQVPTKESMEQDLERFVSESISDCDFQTYYDQGYLVDINPDDIETNVVINDNTIDVDLRTQLSISDGQSAGVVEDHKIQVNSKLGKFYGMALEIYDKEKKEMFLENYAVDTLRFYAPVDGVEVSCAPLVWDANKVVSDLQDGIESNTLVLKTRGNYYSLKNKENEYFVIDTEDYDESVNFLNSKDWPYKIEVSPTDGSLMLAQPIGNQPGLGILGFCYVPYHFVYDVSYPVLIQVYNQDELFQFPVAVVIKGNKPREALVGDSVNPQLSELCSYKNTNVKVNVYNTNLERVEAAISFECFGTTCNIGETSDGVFEGGFPQCVNGFVRARADGYVDGKSIISTNQPGEVDVILDKKYELNVVLKKNGQTIEDQSIVSFVSEKNTVTISYPEQKTISLSEGQYNVSVYSYSSSNINLQAEVKEQCIDIPTSGVFALFGSTKKKCFEINIPAQILSQALTGGGKQSYYVAESELQGSGNVEINFDGLTAPGSVDDLQNNYEGVETQGLDIKFE